MWSNFASAAVILQYHHVSEDTPFSTSLSPKQFESHLALLKANNFNVVPLAKLITQLKNKEVIAPRTVVITFDDGYQNVADNAAPLLNEYGYAYTIFVNPGAIARQHNSTMSWETLKQLQTQGASIANHTLHHDYLVERQPNESKQQWLDRLTHDFTHAEQMIAKHTGDNFRYLAYPYGEFNSEIQSLVSSLNFIGFGQHSGAVGIHNDLTRIPRFPASGPYADTKTLLTKLNSLPFTFISKQFADPLTSSTTPSLTLKLDTRNFNKAQLQCYASHEGKIEVTWKDEFTLSTQATKPLPEGRSRYNCTAPAKVNNDTKGTGPAFYWFSQPWVFNKSSVN